MSIIVGGIHTGIGKTVCSAILCEALGYDYWKPVQAGDLDNSDSIFVKNHTSEHQVIHPEAYKLSLATSPHRAAKEDGILIQKEEIRLPESERGVVVETAGGLMSPLSHELLNIDLAKHLQLPLVLVSHQYLGSINHTLLSIAALKQYNVPVLGMIYVGEDLHGASAFITSYTGIPLLFNVPIFETLNKETVMAFAKSIPPLSLPHA